MRTWLTRRILLKAISHSRGKPITVPGGTDQVSERIDAGNLVGQD
jgi:hypothetical protein